LVNDLLYSALAARWQLSCHQPGKTAPSTRPAQRAAQRATGPADGTPGREIPLAGQGPVTRREEAPGLLLAWGHPGSCEGHGSVPAGGGAPCQDESAVAGEGRWSAAAQEDPLRPTGLQAWQLRVRAAPGTAAHRLLIGGTLSERAKQLGECCPGSVSVSDGTTSCETSTEAQPEGRSSRPLWGGIAVADESLPGEDSRAEGRQLAWPPELEDGQPNLQSPHRQCSPAGRDHVLQEFSGHQDWMVIEAGPPWWYVETALACRKP
jgi:hypothetical protein